MSETPHSTVVGASGGHPAAPAAGSTAPLAVRGAGQRVRSPWRVLRAAREPAARQFALSEALLTVGLPTTGRPALRWYIARQPALILGNGQK
ncbi:MAG TPA: hypothetical protein VKT52_06650, partial [Ktedonobacterales bacterium]|nr:hypothetical protein [Ktedonobacterales bacterium]